MTSIFDNDCVMIGKVNNLKGRVSTLSLISLAVCGVCAIACWEIKKMSQRLDKLEARVDLTEEMVDDIIVSQCDLGDDLDCECCADGTDEVHK